MRTRLIFLAATTAAAMLVLGCSADDEEGEPLPAHCNPLSADSCLLPWPSSFYLKPDSTSATGFRLAYPSAAMPKTKDGVPVDPRRFNLLDGFSVGSQALVYFKSGVGRRGLPGPSELARSVTAQSPIRLLEYKTGAAVPLFAELDANAKGREVPPLIIRPQVPLRFNSRYVVVLRSTLEDSGGAPLEPPPPFKRLRDGLETADPTLELERSRVEEVLAFLAKQGMPRDDVVLAWDFHTSSQAAVTGNLVSMVDGALSRLPATGPKVTSVKTLDFDAASEPDLLREIEGELEVPSFLESDSLDSWLKLDARGRPVYRGPQKFSFWVYIPRCATTAQLPLPVLLFGHGIFGSPRSECRSLPQKQLINKLCMIEAGVLWRGLSEPDIPAIVQQVIMDFSKMPRITDPLQQAHVNMHALTRLMQGPFLKDAALAVNGQPVADGKEIYYLGVSNGGNQGPTFAALSKEIERFVFHVAGGWWSLMMQRSSGFAVLSLALETIYPDALDRVILVSLTQHLWDHVDPISFASYLRGTPLPGRSRKLVVMQESKDDDSVPNLATRAVARAIGLDALSPVGETVYGLAPKTGPLEVGYSQWDTHPPVKPPSTNTPAAKPKPEDSAHIRLRTVGKCIEQMRAFLKPGGQLVHTCSGACDPE